MAIKMEREREREQSVFTVFHFSGIGICSAILHAKMHCLQSYCTLSVSVFVCVSGLMELVHKAAYRETLGRSLYMPENRIGSFTADNVNRFY